MLTLGIFTFCEVYSETKQQYQNTNEYECANQLHLFTLPNYFYKYNILLFPRQAYESVF